MPDTLTQQPRATTVVARATARRTARSGALWGALFGAMVANEALSYRRNFPTLATRLQFESSFGGNGGLTAVTGPARRLATIEGFVSWRMFSLMLAVGAFWGLLTATRSLRGEEDAGRWELLLAGRTGRRHATVQALVGLAAGWLALWLVTALLIVAAGLRPSVGFSVTGSLFYATAGTASAAIFLAVGALASQLGTTRRQATGIGAAFFGLCYVVRMVADSGASLGWLRWASPLGWVENLSPLTAPQPWALVPILVLVVGAVGGTVVLAGRRDVGVGVLHWRSARMGDTRMLTGPWGLTLRLERWVALSWVAGLALLALVFGLVARAAAKGHLGDTSIGQVAGSGAGHGGLASAWLGYEFLYLAAILAFAAAGQVSALREEEADGNLDHLLSRRLGRRAWLVSRIGFAALVVAAAGVAMGLAGWAGAGADSGIGGADMVHASLNLMVPGLFVLGVGTLLYGLVPRRAAPLLYALVLWSFLVEVVGTTITSSRWLVDTSVLAHLGPVPATGVRWEAMAWIAVTAVVAAGLGVLAFDRRDLVGH